MNTAEVVTLLLLIGFGLITIGAAIGFCIWADCHFSQHMKNNTDRNEKSNTERTTPERELVSCANIACDWSGLPSQADIERGLRICPECASTLPVPPPDPSPAAAGQHRTGA